MTDPHEDARMLHIPVLSIVLLIGISGSGKSMFARQHFSPSEVLSSDQCRMMICDDEGDQSATPDAFELLRVILAKRLAFRRLCVVDATNVQQHARMRSLRIASALNVPAVAIVLDVPPAICIDRASARTSRLVDESVVKRQYDDLLLSKGQLVSEGYERIYTISQADMGMLRIVRTRPRNLTTSESELTQC